ncbi:MAG: ABC transporter substrate-binding protein [Saccharofermentans sp.]|nr:ABC transporter substrate-binding protein [Saccharofermentans sp.]
MKKFVAGLLAFCMMAGLVTACGKKEDGAVETVEKKDTVKTDDGKIVINLWSFTDEVPKMVDKYIELHPEFGEKYEVKVSITPTTDGAYQPALDTALTGGGADSPDMFCAEAAFVLKYTQGDMSMYAAPYSDLGIDVDKDIADAQIAPYSVDIGTRTADGKVVALGYQATGGAFIYRRSIAKDVFGTDDPAAIADEIGSGSQNWDKFYEAAAKLKENGTPIISGDGDIWHAIENSSEAGWVADDTLVIDGKREAFIDISKDLTDNGWSNQTQDWTEAWYADMAGTSETPCFGFFGPAWLINYTMGEHCDNTYGDWAVCPPPVGFFWGGTWVIANAASSDEVKAGVGELIRWITLDTSETGLQYMWANGTLNGEGGTKDSVASNTVMAKSNGELEFLGGQNMFDVFVPANEYANGKNLTQYDEKINSIWRDQVRQYTAGEATRDEAIENFKTGVAGELGLAV